MQDHETFDEEVQLDGQPVRKLSDKGQLSEHEEGRLNQRNAKLASILPDASSNVDLVDAILQLPIESLIPWETCQLPSNGLYYDWSVSNVEVRAMGQKAERILATQRLAQDGQSIDYLFRECVRFPDPSFDPMDLLVGDRTFLLYYLRGITHGNIYEFAMTCPSPQCEKTSTHSYDLNELASTIKAADSSLGNEPFKVSLPYLSKSMNRDVWVELRFLRGRDINNMVSMRRTRKRISASTAVRAGSDPRYPMQRQETRIDDTLTENLQMVMVSVMGVRDRHKIDAFVHKMHATDTAAIREWLRDNSPGIDPTVKIKCPECAQELNIELPVTESFFRPTQK